MLINDQHNFHYIHISFDSYKNAQQASTFAVIYFLLFICEGQPELYFFYSLVRFAQLACLFSGFAFSFQLFFMTFTALEIHDHDQAQF